MMQSETQRMIKIGLLSDTHHYLDPQIAEYFATVDEIWHAGDFGTIAIARELEEIAPLRGVYGNIDGKDVRDFYPCHDRFEIEGVRFWMTHIGGHPGRCALPIRREMEVNPPDVFICGHSHILKIVRDPVYTNVLHINPGAAGRQGFQTMRTIVRFGIEGGKLHDVEVINLGTRAD